jgi:hypothetical protein
LNAPSSGQISYRLALSFICGTARDRSPFVGLAGR